MSSTDPIPCRYYKLTNNGIGIEIWPKVLDPSDQSMLWDGRNHSGYSLNIQQSVTVDLSVADMDAGTLFILAENTLFGHDMCETNQVFSFDPNSTVTATAVRDGAAKDGSLTYMGISS